MRILMPFKAGTGASRESGWDLVDLLEWNEPAAYVASKPAEGSTLRTSFVFISPECFWQRSLQRGSCVRWWRPRSARFKS